jgi:AmpE protein
MTLISALLGIAVDRLVPDLHAYRNYDPLLRYFDWGRDRVSVVAGDSVGGLLLVLLPVWALVAALQMAIDDWLFGIIGLLFYVAVLVYCLGPRDLAADADSFRHAVRTADPQLVRRAAAQLLGAESTDTEGLEEKASAGLLVQACDRLFAVLFWFVLLGPVGAVAYRSVAIVYHQRGEEHELAASAGRLFAALVWLPARLLALGYALSGHFEAALQAWREAHHPAPSGSDGSLQILSAVGSAALGTVNGAAEPVRAAVQLVWRTLVIWMVVIALFTLAGWTR